MRVKKLKEYKTNEQRFIYWPQILSFAFHIPLPLCFFRANPVCTVHSTNMAAKVVRIVLEKPLIICQIIEKSIIVLFFAANGNKHNA